MAIFKLNQDKVKFCARERCALICGLEDTCEVIRDAVRSKNDFDGSLDE